MTYGKLDESQRLRKVPFRLFYFLFFINLMQLQWNDWHFTEDIFKYIFFVHCKPGSFLIVGSFHYDDVLMGAIASQITSLTIVYSTVYSGADQSKHQSSASLAFVWGIHRGPVNSPHKWPVTRKMFPLDDVIMFTAISKSHGWLKKN